MVSNVEAILHSKQKLFLKLHFFYELGIFIYPAVFLLHLSDLPYGLLWYAMCQHNITPAAEFTQ